MELTLTASQLAQLRRERTDGPNKILIALHLRYAKQQDLAEATGLHKSKVSEIVNGHYSRISLNSARRIAVAFGACIEDIFPPACVARDNGTPNGKRLNAARGRKRAA